MEKCHWSLINATTRRLGDSDFLREVNILDSLQKRYAIVHRFLKRFATGYQTHAAGAFVDDGGTHRIMQIVRSGLATGVDHAGTAHLTVGDLIAHQVDGVITGQIAIYFRMRLAELKRVVAAVIHSHLLLDDVCIEGRGEMVGLTRNIRAGVIVNALVLERLIPGVSPQDAHHA